ncbi:hypothetical protein QQ054_04710 [Oscillatoria amoena NRMC-F 0135]|nr:hypothetical protein [Oscillatoria amoena NRMC-F 0135]MDL5053494.1 hypothetical protein [Oscillatoria laete-virens NRMC-F 0139]
MADFPFSLRLTLRSGTIYYFTHRALSSKEPHYFIVLNQNPLDDTALILAIGSSQVEKVIRRRAGLPPETLIRVKKGEVKTFHKETIIDCNCVFELSREELIEKFQSKELRSHEDLPQEILIPIWKGVLASPLIENRIKKIIQNDFS